MGTIAELLGYALEGDSPKGDESAQDLLDGNADARAQERAQRLDEISMTAVLEETGLEPADARADLGLRDDLDLDDIALFAIVSAIEHEAGVSITDEAVRSWTTLGDLLDGVRAAATA